jgi:hypothetical protein
LCRYARHFFFGPPSWFLVRSGITGGSNGSFANLVSKLTQHDASPVQWAHALEPVRLPLLKLRANHTPNPALRKSLIFGGTSAWKSKKSEKSKMSNRLTIEFAGQSQEINHSRMQASRGVMSRISKEAHGRLTEEI